MVVRLQPRHPLFWGQKADRGRQKLGFDYYTYLSELIPTRQSEQQAFRRKKPATILSGSSVIRAAGIREKNFVSSSILRETTLCDSSASVRWNRPPAHNLMEMWKRVIRGLLYVFASDEWWPNSPLLSRHYSESIWAGCWGAQVGSGDTWIQEEQWGDFAVWNRMPTEPGAGHWIWHGVVIVPVGCPTYNFTTREKKGKVHEFTSRSAGIESTLSHTVSISFFRVVSKCLPIRAENPGDALVFMHVLVMDDPVKP